MGRPLWSPVSRRAANKVVYLVVARFEAGDDKTGPYISNGGKYECYHKRAYVARQSAPPAPGPPGNGSCCRFNSGVDLLRHRRGEQWFSYLAGRIELSERLR